MIGKFDAAVIDQQDGKPHIVKRMDRSRLRVIPAAATSLRGHWSLSASIPRPVVNADSR